MPRIALVTGSSRGIGRAVALRLAADGLLVAVHYAHDEEAAARTVQGIHDAGGRAFAVKADLAEAGSVEELFAGFESGLRGLDVGPRLDVLVNNAASSGRGSIEEFSRADFDRLVALNMSAPLFAVQRALPLMDDGGRIIAISSAAVRVALQDPAYAMTKGALNALTFTLANSLGRRGITVNAVAPGPVATDMNPGLRDPFMGAVVAGLQAVDRIAEPEDIAEVVAFLASPASRWVTGQILDASGGFFLGPHFPS